MTHRLVIWGCGHGSFEPKAPFLRWDNGRQYQYTTGMLLTELAKIFAMPGVPVERVRAYSENELSIYREDASLFRCPRCRSTALASHLLMLKYRSIKQVFLTI